MEQRPHFTYALYDLSRFRFLLLIPIARILVGILRGQIPAFYRYEWVVGGILLGYVFLKWRCCRYHLAASDNGRFHTVGVRQGVVWRRALHIAAEEAASVEIERTPLLWLLGGRRIRVNTAGLRRRADVQLYLSAAETRKLFVSHNGKRGYRAARWPIVVMALTGSNAAVGLLTVAPLINRVGQLLGQEITPDVVGLVERLVSLGLPPILRVIANALVIGWAVSALRIFLRYQGFRSRREHGYLHLTSGLLTRRDVLIDNDKITALELRQTLTMRVFSLYTAVITAAGYGRDIGTRPVLIPAARPRELSAGLDRLLAEFPVCGSVLHPMKRAWWRYTMAPISGLAVGGILWWRGAWWRMAALVWTIFAVWWLLVRVFGFFQAGFGYSPRGTSLCYPRGLALYRVYLPTEIVDCITVTQSIFQRRSGYCTVRVRCFGEKKRVHRVVGLPYEVVWHMLAQKQRRDT